MNCHFDDDNNGGCNLSKCNVFVEWGNIDKSKPKYRKLI